MSTKSAYFLDFHGTISSLTFWSTLSSDKYAAIQNRFFAERKDLVCSWMRGSCAYEEVITEVSKIAGIDTSELRGRAFRHDAPIIDQGILEFLVLLRERSYIFLISDNMDILAERFHRDRLDEYFDEVWFSCENGALKNEFEGAAYVKLAEQYNLRMSDCILFDDSWSSVKTFFNKGGTGIKVSSITDTRNYLELIGKDSIVCDTLSMRAA